MPHDLLSLTANSSVMSSVLRIKFWDPKNDANLGDADISSGMMVKVFAKPSNNTYKVRVYIHFYMQAIRGYRKNVYQKKDIFVMKQVMKLRI